MKLFLPFYISFATLNLFTMEPLACSQNYTRVVPLEIARLIAQYAEFSELPSSRFLTHRVATSMYVTEILEKNTLLSLNWQPIDKSIDTFTQKVTKGLSKKGPTRKTYMKDGPNKEDICLHIFDKWTKANWNDSQEIFSSRVRLIPTNLPKLMQSLCTQHRLPYSISAAALGNNRYAVDLKLELCDGSLLQVFEFKKKRWQRIESTLIAQKYCPILFKRLAFMAGNILLGLSLKNELYCLAIDDFGITVYPQQTITKIEDFAVDQLNPFQVALLTDNRKLFYADVRQRSSSGAIICKLIDTVENGEINSLHFYDNRMLLKQWYWKFLDHLQDPMLTRRVSSYDIIALSKKDFFMVLASLAHPEKTGNVQI